MNIEHLVWPSYRLGECLQELAQRSELLNEKGKNANIPQNFMGDDPMEIGRWLIWASSQLGLETEQIEISLAECPILMNKVGPALLQVNNGFLVLLPAASGLIRLLSESLQVQTYPASEFSAWLALPFQQPILDEIAQTLELTQVPKQRRYKVQTILLNERLATQKISTFWLLRLPPNRNFWQQLVHAGLPNKLLAILFVSSFVYILETSSWALIGHGVLNGRFDWGWFSAWLLLIFSMLPFQLFNNWLDSSFALELGRIMKKRLMAGALQSDLQSVKSQGVGQLMSRVMDSQALESLAMNGGFSVIITSIELIFSVVILSIGAGGRLPVGALIFWLILTVSLCWRYYRQLRLWTAMRLDMTHDLIESMIGHRTRLAQESEQKRQSQEDQTLFDYLTFSESMDSSLIPIAGGLSRGWLLIGIASLAPAFIAGTHSQAEMAISLGGILLANRALGGLAGGLSALGRAAIAWSQVSAIFKSADQKLSADSHFLDSKQNLNANADNGCLIDASDLVFRYQDQGDPVLRGVNLSINQGEKILLEGSSGGGKSTLASLLVGLRKPNSGLLLLKGLDRHTLGDSWHHLATEAPQFHENHILTGTLAFNLLMGRNWPATVNDLKEAEQLCHELGLSDLLAKMPAGLLQRVGETGWQLSHGEKSRIFLARALLQNASLTVLDESFAALDPKTLEQCLACAFMRAETLLVIAHP